MQVLHTDATLTQQINPLIVGGTAVGQEVCVAIPSEIARPIRHLCLAVYCRIQPHEPTTGGNFRALFIQMCAEVTGAHSQIPWMVALKQVDEFRCTGTLVAPQWVLTAGHCVGNFDNVVIGALDWKMPSEDAEAFKV